MQTITTRTTINNKVATMAYIYRQNENDTFTLIRGGETVKYDLFNKPIYYRLVQRGPYTVKQYFSRPKNRWVDDDQTEHPNL